MAILRHASRNTISFPSSEILIFLGAWIGWELGQIPGSIPSEAILGGTASHFSAQCFIWKLKRGARPNQSVGSGLIPSITTLVSAIPSGAA